MEITKVTPESIRKESDEALLNLHRHLHGLWSRHFAGGETTTDGLTKEDLVNAHIFVRDDMARRRMRHADEPRDGLDKATHRLAGPAPAGRGRNKGLNDVLSEPTEDTILVPAIVTITGSVGEGREKTEDLDVLIRADRIEQAGNSNFLIRAEDIELPIRKRLDPEKTGLGIHWNANPQGPHADYLHMADLVLRWRNPVEQVSVKTGRRVRQVRVAQIQELLTRLKELEQEIEGFLTWAEYRDVPLISVVDGHYIQREEKQTPLIPVEFKPAVDEECICPECEHESEPAKGKACIETKCPKCGTLMKAKEPTAAEPIKAELKVVAPGKRYSVMKPSMTGVTEYFSTDELWGWTQKKLEDDHILLGSPKVDGFRAVISKDGDTSVWFEDSKETRTPPGMPELTGPSFVIEGEFTAKRGDKWLARTQLAGVVAGKTEARPHFWLYDLLYHDGQDVSQRPFTERLILLKKLKLPERYFTVLAQRSVRGQRDLEAVGKWAAGRPLSEGLFLRVASAKYAFGSSDSCAKLKTVAELKVQIIGSERKKNGIVYHVGLRKPGKFSNVSEDLLDLGNTFVGPDQRVKIGDTLNVVCEELVIGEKDDKPILFWGKPTVHEPDKSRPAYTTEQAISLARRKHILKEEIAAPEIKAAKLEETRGERAGRSWKDNWAKLVTKGEGKFILHGHFPALTEEESKWDLRRLLAANKQYHTDLRNEAPRPNGAWGFTDYEGRSSKVGPKGTRLYKMPSGKPMRGSFKLEQPRAWLTHAKNKPEIHKDVGVTGKDCAKFFALDWGRYKLTFARQHAFEIIYDGTKGVVDGRYQINYVPVGDERVWMISRPEAQDKIYADEHKLDTVRDDVRRKGQQWLFWRESLDAPLQKINVRGKEDKMLDLNQELTELELLDLGRTVKAAATLRTAVEDALERIGKEDAKGAIGRLRAALDKVNDYGYGYGEPTSEKAVSANAIKKELNRCIAGLEDDEPDYDKAKSILQKLLDRLGYGSPGKAVSTDALKKQLMSVIGELNRDEPDMEKIAKVLQSALGKLGKGETKTAELTAVKMLREENDGAVVGGHLLLWGNPGQKDLDGDYFTPETNLWLNEYKSVPAMFHHGLDAKIGLTAIGKRLKAAKDDVGVWVEDWLDKSHKYWAFIEKLLKAGALYYSPGSAPHLVERETDGRLKSFAVVDDTLTPIPCQYRLRPVSEIQASYKAVGLELPNMVLDKGNLREEIEKTESELKRLMEV